MILARLSRVALLLTLTILVACTAGDGSQPESSSASITTTDQQPTVPDIVSGSATQAKATLRGAGLRPHAAHDWSRKPKGSIIRQRPVAGTVTTAGSRVSFVVSDGLPVIPHWLSKGIDGPVATYGNAATMELARLALKLGDVVPVVSDKYWQFPGYVIGSTPQPGRSVPPGTTVKLFVVKPPSCTPGYSACLPPHFAAHSWKDYDCAGGSGDGPYFAPYTRVWGADPYGLDDDSDGIGCESS